LSDHLIPRSRVLADLWCGKTVAAQKSHGVSRTHSHFKTLRKVIMKQKKGFVNGIGAIVANDQAATVAEPSQGAFHLPATFVPTQRPAILGARLAAIPAMRCHQSIPRAANRLRSGSLS
jgi:hypothetical protein